VAFLGSLKNLFGSKKSDERTDLEKKIKASPNDPQLRQKLALVLLKQREVVEGVGELAKAAELYEKDGFAGKAVAVLRQLLKYDIENVEMQQRLIGLLARQGLSGDALGELDKFNKGLAGKLSDDQRVDFYTKIAESLPQTPLPHLYAVDTLLTQHKLFESVSALEKASDLALASGDIARFIERLKALVEAAGESDEHLEPCGFLWLRIGDPGQGLPLLQRVRDDASAAGDAERLATIDRVMAAIAEGWDLASAKVIGFEDASHKLALRQKPAAAQPEARAVEAAPAADSAPGAEPPPFPGTGPADDGGAQEADEEDASMVKDALGRLQAKVDEEIGDSDLETRYNLGIAYKEMGLLDEAMKEFRIAARKADLRVGATTLLADVMADRGDVDAATAELDALVESGILDSSAIRDVRYHKAMLLEKLGRERDAADIFLAISVESPGYRDARARADRLGH
jgi:tetratricopeptide (TPR) repeat protein